MTIVNFFAMLCSDKYNAYEARAAKLRSAERWGHVLFQIFSAAECQMTRPQPSDLVDPARAGMKNCRSADKANECRSRPERFCPHGSTVGENFGNSVHDLIGIVAHTKDRIVRTQNRV